MAENRTEIKQREYLIGDMSEIVGVSRDTLRFYEKKGIIKARKKENGSGRRPVQTDGYPI